MEIAPIAGIRVLPAIKSRPMDPGPADTEPAAWVGDDTESKSGKKAAGAEESEDENQEIEEADGEKEDAVDEELGTGPAPPGRINLFA